jgi:hypothetical protein
MKLRLNFLRITFLGLILFNTTNSYCQNRQNNHYKSGYDIDLAFGICEIFLNEKIEILKKKFDKEGTFYLKTKGKDAIWSITVPTFLGSIEINYEIYRGNVMYLKIAADNLIKEDIITYLNKNYWYESSNLYHKLPRPKKDFSVEVIKHNYQITYFYMARKR